MPERPRQASRPADLVGRFFRKRIGAPRILRVATVVAHQAEHRVLLIDPSCNGIAAILPLNVLVNPFLFELLPDMQATLGTRQERLQCSPTADHAELCSSATQ